MVGWYRWPLAITWAAFIGCHHNVLRRRCVLSFIVYLGAEERPEYLPRSHCQNAPAPWLPPSDGSQSVDIGVLEVSSRTKVDKT